MARDFTTVGVVGLGTMGAGHRRGVRPRGPAGRRRRADRGRPRARPRAPAQLHRPGGTPGQADRGRPATPWSAGSGSRTSMEDLADVDLVIEAVPERLDLKREIFAAIDKVCRADTDPGDQHLLAVGDRDLGGHHPAVEGRRDALLQPGAGAQAGRGGAHRRHRAGGRRGRHRRWPQRLGKTPVVIGDKAGFIANALLFGYLNHAVSMVESRYATREDIDAAMRLGCGYPMGPLALLDLIGLDTAYEILDTMYRQSRDRLHAPAPILKQMVTAGLRGRKTGQGFYTYEAPDSPKVVDDGLTPATGDAHGSRPRGPARSASSAPARWPPASSRCSPRPATTCSTSTRGDEKVARVRAALERSLDKARAARQARAGRPRRRAGPGQRLGAAGRPGRPRPGHRGRGRGALGQAGAVRDPGRDLPAGRGARDHDVVAAGHRPGGRDRPARPTSSGCTSSTRRR